MLENSLDYQKLVSEMTAPKQIVALAIDLGYSVSVKDLRNVSRDLCAPWWPWSQKGNAWRRAFFGG